jgi:NAD(P)-dependent dehydrogenase (short-subunit alcohol dehydrogenase family)
MRKQTGQDEATFEREFFKTVRPTSLLKRFTTIEEIADMVAFLSSPLASATNGAAVRADGGVVKAIL